MLAPILRREFEKEPKPVQIEVGHALRNMTGWTMLQEFVGSIRFSRFPAPKPTPSDDLGCAGNTATYLVRCSQ